MKKFLAIMSMLVLSACQNSTSDKFLGKWSRVQTDGVKLDIQLDIVKNGDSYLVKRTMPSFVDGKLQTHSMPAVYKDGLLQIPSEMLTYSIDQQSGRITDGKSEYQLAAK